MILKDAKKIKRLHGILKKNDMINSNVSDVRRALLVNCGVGGICERIDMNLPTALFVPVLCTALSELHMKNRSRPGLNIFIDNFAIFEEDDLSDDEIQFIKSIIEDLHEKPEKISKKPEPEPEQKPEAEPAQVSESESPKNKKPVSVVVNNNRDETLDKDGRVFISYAEEDFETAQKIYHDLKARKIPVWMDKFNLIPGQKWKIEIKNAVKKSSYVLALLSSNSVTKRGYFQNELKLAFDVLDTMPQDDIFIIPGMLDDCSPSDERLTELHWAKFSDSYKTGLEQILRVLGNVEETEKEEEEEEKKEVETRSDVEIESDENRILRIPLLESGIEINFAWIPPGEFMMGSPKDEPGRFDNEIQHKVRLTKGFYMQTTQVTQGQWKAVMGNNPSYFKNAGENCPVEMVSWNDTKGFIKQLNDSEEKMLYGLPTEAQWEYACRAGSQTAIYSGDMKILGERNAPALDKIAWYGGNSRVDYEGGYDSSDWEEKQYESEKSGTHPVGLKTPNAWGFYDMIGNVWEWCEDWFSDYPKESVTDPTGPEGGSYRVYRGGSWVVPARFCRSAVRSGWDVPGGRFRSLGFRLVRSET